MALLTFVGDIGAGDETSANDKLIFKIYNNGVLFYTSGDASSDITVSLSGSIVTIIEVPITAGTYNFRMTATDEAGNEQGTKSNEQTITIVEVTGFPVLSNFNINDTNKDRVVFDASADITGMTTTGFVISNKTILSVTIDGDGLGGYFTVSAAFDFWDNNTIRLGENSDTTNRQSAILYNFTLSYIVNNITEPTAAVNRYASITGGGLHDGTSEANAWTLQEAIGIDFGNQGQAVAGETVWVKAGNYGNINLDCRVHGTSTSPIKYIGYKTIIGDISTNYYDYGVTFSNTEMPTLTGNDSGTGILLQGTTYVIFKNIQVRDYAFGFNGSDQIVNNHLVFERINGYTFAAGADSGACFMNWQIKEGTGDSTEAFISSDYMKVIDCVGINSNMANYQLFGDGNNLIKNCKSYADQDTAASISDYHFAVNGHNCIITGCHAENKVFDNTANGGTWSGLYTHGIQIRGSQRGSVYGNNYNLIENCTSVSVLESLAIRNYGCDYNVIKDCISKKNGSYGDSVTNGWHSGGLVIWGGADYNIIERCSVLDQPYGIMFWDNDEENNYSGNEIGDNNIIRNCIIAGCNWTIAFQGETTPTSPLRWTKLYNNTFYNNNFLLRDGPVDLTEFKFKNCIFKSIGSTSLNENSDILDTEITFESCDFHTNFGSWSPAGTGNISLDPNFLTVVEGGFVPQESGLTVAPKLFGVEYDINKAERESTTTIGAVKHASE